jgi:signal transduction histidine kinase
MLLVLILTLAFTGLYVALSLQAARDRALAMMALTADITAVSVDRYLLNLKNQLGLLGRDLLPPGGSFDPADATLLLRRFREANPELNPVNVTRIDGQIVATSETRYFEALPSLAALPTFQEAVRDMRAGTSLHVSRPFPGVVTKQWLIAVRCGLKDPQGNLLYTVGAGLPLTESQVFWNNAKLPPGAAIGLSRVDGHLLSRYPIPQDSSLENLYANAPSGPLARYLVANPQSRRGWIEGANRLTGAKTFYWYQRLEHFPFTLFIINPAANVWRDWWEDSKFFFLLLATFYVVGGATFLAARRRQDEWDRQRTRYITDLESANAELEAFTYTVSHDLRAPVRAIDGYAALIDEEYGAMLPADGRRLFARLRAAGARMGQLIDTLLDFARRSRQEIKPQRVDMVAMVQSVMAETIHDGDTPEVLVKAMPAAQADPDLIRLVWVNLLSNAVKYSHTVVAPKIEIGFAGGLYYVQDNGVGFDMSYAERLFGVFSRLHGDTDFEGLGIGLATVCRIVKRHGGGVFAHGEVGKGARFSFSLPA